MVEAFYDLKLFAPSRVIAIGNGSNDQRMLEEAEVGIAVIGSEGCSGWALRVADLIVNRIEDAFGLLLNPQRLSATLRR
ncbi:MAG: HAD hydrolase family protein [Desulfitobacteriaceae bacterium]